MMPDFLKKQMQKGINNKQTCDLIFRQVFFLRTSVFDFDKKEGKEGGGGRKRRRGRRKKRKREEEEEKEREGYNTHTFN